MLLDGPCNIHLSNTNPLFPIFVSEGNAFMNSTEFGVNDTFYCERGILKCVKRHAKRMEDRKPMACCCSGNDLFTGKELVEKLEIKLSCEDYYLTMCSVGKFLLAQEVHTKTLRLYDYKTTAL